jgi:DNA-binding response OmpR family regulator
MTEKSYSLLVVDDEAMVRNILRDFLESSGFAIDTASSGAEAMEKIKNCVFDAAIFAMTLPDIDGEKLVEQVLEARSDLCCFIHTGSGYYSVPDNLKNRGVTQDHVFYKPIQSMMTFADTIRKLIASAK